MAIIHKAFAFDFELFDRELSAPFEAALRSLDCAQLVDFISTYKDALRDPHDGGPLPADWQSLVDPDDVQAHASLALTRYYDPAVTIGVAERFSSEEFSDNEQIALMGTPISAGEVSFDPNGFGAYFQTVDEARLSIRLLSGTSNDALRSFADRVREVVRAGKGLYVHFE